MHILSPETDNCPSWISGRERMTVENISWSISTKECCRPRRGLNPRPLGLQSDGASNWATEAGRRLLGILELIGIYADVKNSTHKQYTNVFVKCNLRAKSQTCASKEAETGDPLPKKTSVFLYENIKKTCLYNFDPLKPHFYIVKLGFTGVYIIFSFLLKNINSGTRKTASSRRF